MFIDRLDIDTARYRLTLFRTGAEAWQWMLIAPRELVLSGEAPSRERALDEARRAAGIWAQRAVAAIDCDVDRDRAAGLPPS